MSIAPQSSGAGNPAARRFPPGDGGFTLLAVLIMLASATILGSVVTLALLGVYDRAARYAEVNSLADLHRAIRHRVMESTSIPGAVDLLGSAAPLAGLSRGQAEMSVRRTPRVVLVEPGLAIGPSGTGALPYIQGMTGSLQPLNPRLLLLSSTGDPLPTNLVSGASLTVGQFSNLWSTAQGQVPSDWNWSGNPGDLCIERVHLDDLFVRITLRYHNSSAEHRGKYTLGSQGLTTNSPAQLPGLTNFVPYVIRGTSLSLYGTNNVLQFRDVVQEDDLVYTCRNGIWYRGLGNGGTRVGPVIRHPTPQEFADCLMNFLSPEVPLWSQNTTSTKSNMETAIINFLTAGAYNNKSSAMGTSQKALIDAWVAFTGANPNKP